MRADISKTLSLQVHTINNARAGDAKLKGYTNLLQLLLTKAVQAFVERALTLPEDSERQVSEAVRLAL